VGYVGSRKAIKCRECGGKGEVTDKLMCVGTLSLAPLMDGITNLMLGTSDGAFSKQHCEACNGQGAVLVEPSRRR